MTFIACPGLNLCSIIKDKVKEKSFSSEAKVMKTFFDLVIFSDTLNRRKEREKVRCDGTVLYPASWRQSYADLFEFWASQVYIVRVCPK